MRGAVVVDGQLYSPAMPPSLCEIEVTAVNASRDERLEYQHQIALREKFALVAHGSRKADGRQVYFCPAAAGKVAIIFGVTCSMLLMPGIDTPIWVSRAPMMAP